MFQSDSTLKVLLYGGTPLLTQIRNIRKTILPTQLPSTFLKTCVYTRSISTMKHTHVALAPSFPASPSTHPSPQSHWNTRDDHNSVSGSNPGSFMVMMQIPSHQQTMPTSSAILFQEFQNYQANIETHSSYSKLIRPRSLPCSRVPKLSGEHWDAFPHIRNWHDRDLSPSLSKAWGERKPVVPVPADQHHHHEVLQICSNYVRQ